jgi:hypothetical protein
MSDIINCCLCNKEIEDLYGNNAEPVVKNGRCCDSCNLDKVIPARINGDYLGDDSGFVCDRCNKKFSVFQVTIFSEDEGCSPYMEMNVLCHKCFSKSKRYEV